MRRAVLALALACAYSPALAGPEGPSIYRMHAASLPHVSAARSRASSSRLSAPLSGISAPLAAKARQIVSACGSTVISGIRHTRVAGTRRMSLHASGRAVDLRGNPACIYAQLHGWPGGYSTDYGRVLHVHLSYDPQGGREMGLRFAHRHLPRHTRYARR